MSSYDLDDLLRLVTSDCAESLSLRSGQVPVVHLGGEPHPVEGPTMTAEDAEALLKSLATTRQVREVRERGTAVFIYTSRESAPFRVHATMQQDDVRLEFHRIEP